MVEIIVAVVATIGLAACYKARSILDKKQEEETVEAIKQAVAERNVVVEISVIDGTFYLFDKKTKQFIIQGTDILQISKDLASLHPTKLFMVDSESLKKAMAEV